LRRLFIEPELRRIPTLVVSRLRSCAKSYFEGPTDRGVFFFTLWSYNILWDIAYYGIDHRFLYLVLFIYFSIFTTNICSKLDFFIFSIRLYLLYFFLVYGTKRVNEKRIRQHTLQHSLKKRSRVGDSPSLSSSSSLSPQIPQSPARLSLAGHFKKKSHSSCGICRTN
jgi:hypothetical protein